MDFNDESFAILPKYGGRYFRVPVIHDFQFDGACKIVSMDLYHDPLVAAIAFNYTGWRQVPLTPIMMSLTYGSSAPPSQFSLNATAPGTILNWQVIPQTGLVRVAPTTLPAIISQYYSLESGNQSVASLFMKLDYSVPQAFSALLSPGDPGLIPWAGYYVGGEGADVHVQRRAAFATFASSPINVDYSMAVDGGNVAVTYIMSGTARAGSKGSFKCKATDLFSLVPNPSGGMLIARLVRFFDTWAVASAAHSNL